MGVKNKFDNEALFKNELTGDIRFVLANKSGTKIEIPAHQAIMMSRSPVFEKMFYGDLKEEGPIVTITDVCAEAFEEFLQFFYIEEFDVTTKYLPEVFQLIDKYDAASFWPICEQFLEESMTADVAFLYYELVLMYNLPEALGSQLEDIICKKPRSTFRVGIGGGASLAVLKNILRSEKLKCNEVDIFVGVMSWAKESLNHKGIEVSTENIRNELDDCLYLIRFPIMTTQQFLGCIEQYTNLISPEEYSDILFYISAKRQLTTADRFCTESRLKTYVIQFEKQSNLPIPFYRSNSCKSESVFKLLHQSSEAIKYKIDFDIPSSSVASLYCLVSITDIDGKTLYNDRCDQLPSMQSDWSLLLKFTVQNPIIFKPGAEYNLNICFQKEISSNYKIEQKSVPDKYPLKIVSGNASKKTFVSEMRFNESID